MHNFPASCVCVCKTLVKWHLYHVLNSITKQFNHCKSQSIQRMQEQQNKKEGNKPERMLVNIQDRYCIDNITKSNAIRSTSLPSQLIHQQTVCSSPTHSQAKSRNPLKLVTSLIDSDFWPPIAYPAFSPWSSPDPPHTNDPGKEARKRGRAYLLSSGDSGSRRVLSCGLSQVPPTRLRQHHSFSVLSPLEQNEVLRTASSGTLSVSSASQSRSLGSGNDDMGHLLDSNNPMVWQTPLSMHQSMTMGARGCRSFSATVEDSANSTNKNRKHRKWNSITSLVEFQEVQEVRYQCDAGDIGREFNWSVVLPHTQSSTQVFHPTAEVVSSNRRESIVKGLNQTNELGLPCARQQEATLASNPSLISPIILSNQPISKYANRPGGGRHTSLHEPSPLKDVPNRDQVQQKMLGGHTTGTLADPQLTELEIHGTTTTTFVKTTNVKVDPNTKRELPKLHRANISSVLPQKDVGHQQEFSRIPLATCLRDLAKLDIIPASSSSSISVSSSSEPRYIPIKKPASHIKQKSIGCLEGMLDSGIPKYLDHHLPAGGGQLESSSETKQAMNRDGSRRMSWINKLKGPWVFQQSSKTDALPISNQVMDGYMSVKKAKLNRRHTIAQTEQGNKTEHVGSGGNELIAVPSLKDGFPEEEEELEVFLCLDDV